MKVVVTILAVTNIVLGISIFRLDQQATIQAGYIEAVSERAENAFMAAQGTQYDRNALQDRLEDMIMENALDIEDIKGRLGIGIFEE